MTGVPCNNVLKQQVEDISSDSLDELREDESDSSDSYEAEITPISFPKSVKSVKDLGNGRIFTIIRKPYFNALRSAILLLNGESEFYLAQDYLRANSFIADIVPDLEFIIVSLLKDESRKNKLQETVLLLHSVYSLLHSDVLSIDCINNLMDALMFNLIKPESRCSSGSHCYLLKDIVVDIIVTLLERYCTKELWDETVLKLCSVFNYESPSVVQYGAIALTSSIEDFIEELSPYLEYYCRHTFHKSLNNILSRQSTLNVRNKLLLVFKYWMKQWLQSTSLDCNMSVNMEFVTDPVDFFYHFCRHELMQYRMFPSKYMCHRMPPKINTNPFASLSYLMTPSTKKLDAIFKSNLRNFPIYDIKRPEFQEEFRDQVEDEEPFMSQWSDKVNIEVVTLSSEGYLNNIHSKETNDFFPEEMIISNEMENTSSLKTASGNFERTSDVFHSGVLDVSVCSR